MGVWDGVLALWCGVFGFLALAGYGRSLAGASAAQRTVRTTGRIERVRRPRDGGSAADGIDVVVGFRDPSTGEEFTVTNDGDCGDRITAAWVGREIGVRYPPGRAHAFRFTDDLQAGRRGLALPNSALSMVYAGLVVLASIHWGWPWALVAVGGPIAVAAAFALPGERDLGRKRLAALTAVRPVAGRVVAVLTTVSLDADDDLRTSRTPVVAFTTHQGVDVTAYYPPGLPDSAVARGQELTIHYSPADPAVFTPDIDAARKSGRENAGCTVAVLVLTAAAALTGAALLRLPL
ncbi:DUF3592 domain-containing protein [Kitasatospora sp. NPDC056783]|uniref:DUF3592 domain-containing protein n=1 Tax=Kitasatospora sp. NPDC056783 TaxID=3345943 RepID=UPI00367AE6FF